MTGLAVATFASPRTRNNIGYHPIKHTPDDFEEDKELVRRPFASFQRGKKQVEHILAEGVEALHPLTPF